MDERDIYTRQMKDMKLLVLCVDGLDPEYARELGFPKMPYESKLEIPKELFINRVPHTQLVWPSMLSRRIVENAREYVCKSYGIWFREIRLPIRRFLHEHGIGWVRNKEEKRRKWGVNPTNLNLETVADKYNSVIWNIPTICPEFVCEFPYPDDMLRYGRHEYEIWRIISYGMCLYPYHLPPTHP